MRLQSSGATKQCRLCTRPFQACSHTVTWLSPLPGVARADIASGLGAMHATASRSPWPYLLWRHTYYSAILTMAPCLLWRHTYYGAVLTMAPCLLWRHTYYGAVLTMAPYLLWRRTYQAWGDTCIGCRKTSRSLPRVPSGDRCYACKERVYAAERLVAAGEHLLLATTTHTCKFQLRTTNYSLRTTHYSLLMYLPTD